MHSLAVRWDKSSSVTLANSSPRTRALFTVEPSGITSKISYDRYTGSLFPGGATKNMQAGSPATASELRLCATTRHQKALQPNFSTCAVLGEEDCRTQS